MRLTKAVAEFLTAQLRPGDFAVDGTVGQGNDTVWLAEAVGAGGAVWGIDVQARALRIAHENLTQHRLRNRVTLVEGDHCDLDRFLPPRWCQAVAVAVFNLGYLPTGDHAVTTETDSTLLALEAAWKWLRPGGWLSVVAYPGHPAGVAETAAVRGWFDIQAQTNGSLTVIPSNPNDPRAPTWFRIRKAIDRETSIPTTL